MQDKSLETIVLKMDKDTFEELMDTIAFMQSEKWYSVDEHTRLERLYNKLFSQTELLEVGTKVRCNPRFDATLEPKLSNKIMTIVRLDTFIDGSTAYVTDIGYFFSKDEIIVEVV